VVVLLQILHIVTLLDLVDLVAVQHKVVDVVGQVILLLLVLLKDFQVVLQLLLIVVEVVVVLLKLGVIKRCQLQLKDLVVMVYFGLQMLYVVLLLEKPVLLVFIFQVVALVLIPVEH
tara:strand:- start:223 stop:573 length:351 start_codon:yes stop_codon:yes gene_type:complete